MYKSAYIVIKTEEFFASFDEGLEFFAVLQNF